MPVSGALESLEPSFDLLGVSGAACVERTSMRPWAGLRRAPLAGCEQSDGLIVAGRKGGRTTKHALKVETTLTGFGEFGSSGVLGAGLRMGAERSGMGGGVGTFLDGMGTIASERNEKGNEGCHNLC